jgi:hypothetical protein
MSKGHAVTAALLAVLVFNVCHAQITSGSVAFTDAQTASAAVKVNPLRDAFFGDLHLHTSYSFDAYLGGGAVDPLEAYRFAAGESVSYLGRPVRRREPLDFMAVTDHAEYLGVLNSVDDPKNVVHQSGSGRADLVESMSSHWGAPGKQMLTDSLEGVSKSAWQREVDIANRAYEPGKFTAFIGYEWTAAVGTSGLHRNVIFRGNSAPYPFSSLDSNRPEDLWAWLEKIRKEGYEALAIPHNSNVSNGLMYDWVNSEGNPINDLYAQERQLNEPVSEIAQTKGQSEVYPLLAPSDEFANFEVMETWGGVPIVDYRARGSYLRDGYGRGLILERKLGINPFKYGIVGGSDIHSGLSVSAQQDWAGGFWRADLGGGTPSRTEAAEVLKGSIIVLGGPGTTAGALTGVWAESNTRESIFAALRRRETFATSGSRLKMRFFAGWHFPAGLLRQQDWIATAYSEAVAMGGDLPAKPPKATAPVFAIWAVKDPNGPNLDRVQVIKVWEAAGQQRERVFDVVWAGGRQPDPDTGKLPAIGNTVDLKTGQYTNEIGASELKTVWTDPDFNVHRYAAYYLRVLEIPTPRWSTLLAIENGLPLPKTVPATEQQRGWSSSIWYRGSPLSQRAVRGR